MNHADVLRLLFPIELDGNYNADIAIEGTHLDKVEASALELLREMYPDTAARCISSWERVYGISPASDTVLSARRDAVVVARRARGGQSKAYYIGLAAAMGWTITITELQPYTVDSPCDATLYDQIILSVWVVNMPSAPIYSFTVDSPVDEPLSWWPTQSDIENMIRKLKPAHTYVIFNYS